MDDRELNSTKTENGRGDKIEPENGLVSASKTRGEKLSTRDTKKIVLSKPVDSKISQKQLVGLSSLHRDLSNEFNQF